MPWGRTEDTLHDNEKVWSLTDREFRVWWYSVSFCNRKRKLDPEGRLTQEAAENLCRLAKTVPAQIPVVIDGLLRPRPPRGTSFWERHPDGGYVVHDFPDFAPREDRTAAERKRAERDRRRDETRDDEECHADVTRDTHARGKPVPVPGPVPVPVGTQTEHPPERQPAVQDMLSPLAAAESERAAPARSLEPRYSADFEAWWAAYPRKREKVDAYAAYQKTLKAGATAEQLLVAARNCARYVDEQGTEERFIPLPATFLGPSRKWLDFRDGVPRPASRPPARNGAVNGRRESQRDQLDRVFGSIA